MAELSEVLDRWRTEAEVFERWGDTVRAAVLRACASEIEPGAYEWLTWLTEAEAVALSGHHIDWVKGRFESMRARGHARLAEGKRVYRMCAVPSGALEIGSAFDAGREAARAHRALKSTQDAKRPTGGTA